MDLEQCLRWVNRYHKNLDANDISFARKELEKHKVEAKEILSQLVDNDEYVELFKKDINNIDQALKLVQNQEHQNE